MNKTKYKLGDIVLYYRVDGTKGVFIIDAIKHNETGYYYEHNLSPLTTIVTNDSKIIRAINKDPELYKRYQLYLELKKEFG